MAEVIEIINEDGSLAGEWFGVIGGDVFRPKSDKINKKHGWEPVQMEKADFEELTRQRAKRIRLNVISGKYQYDD